MAQNNKIQIQVEVAGTDKAEKQLNKIEVASEDIKEGVKGVGENFKAVSDVVATSNEKMGAGLAGVGESVIGLTEAMSAFKEVGGKGVLAMLGPLSLLVGALSMAYEAYRQFSGKAQEAEDAAENMAAAAGDTASRLEAMVEAGVNLGTKALQEFIEVNERARLAVEQTIKINEKRTVSDQKVKAATKALEEAESAIFFQETRIAKAKYDLEQATLEYSAALDKQVKSSAEANRLNREAFELQELLMKPYEELVGAVRQEREAMDDLQTRLLATTEIRGKDRLAIENTLKRKKELIAEELKYRDMMRVIEDQLKKGIIRQEDFDNVNKAMREGLSKTAKELKAVNDQLKPYVESLESTKEYTDAVRAANKEAFNKKVSIDIEDINRQIVLLDRNLQDQRNTLTYYGKDFAETIQSQLKTLAVSVTEFYKLREQIRTDIEKSASPRNTYKESIQDDIEIARIMQEGLAREIILTQDEVVQKLIDIEDAKIGLQWRARLKEISAMEISNKRKKKLEEEALNDAIAASTRLKEVTANEIESRVTMLTLAAEEESYLKEQRQLEIERRNSDEKLALRTLETEMLALKANASADVLGIATKLNEDLARSNLMYEQEAFSATQLSKVRELNLLSTYIKEKQAILDSNFLVVSKEDRAKAEAELTNLREQEKAKQAEIRLSQEKVKLTIRNGLREIEVARLESKVREARDERDFTSMFLDDNQVRTKVTMEYYQTLRDESKQAFLTEMQRIDAEIAKQERLIDIRKKAYAATTAKISKPNEGMSVAELAANKDIEIEKAKLANLQQMRKDALTTEEEVKKYHNQRMYEYDLEHYQAVGGMLKDYAATSSQALINNAVAAAFAGESVADSIRTTIRGLAQEATARALFEGAAALGSLAIGDAEGAALHGKSAVAFGIAAAGMGALTAAVGVPGGGSSGGSGSTSPTGLSQSSEGAKREEAKTEAMVFNINFGNAVIYDTKTAAERAMAERVMELGARARRGYNPPRPRI